MRAAPLIRRLMRASRERGYRRALSQVGFMPESIERAVAIDREWIDRGDDNLDPRKIRSRWH